MPSRAAGAVKASPETAGDGGSDPFLSLFLSPGGFFVCACLILPLLLEHISPLRPGAALVTWVPAYAFAWPVVLWFFIAFVVVSFTFKGRLKKLSKADAFAASWYLCNGFFFNSMMDVFAGQFQSWAIMTERYNELEPRYALAASYDGVTVFLTSWQEILIQCPCGLALFYAYWRGKGWRYPLEIVFNCWSVAGVWYFYVSEPVLGFPHVHSPFKVVGGKWEVLTEEMFTFETIYKFWIGFVIFPGLWAIVGTILGMRASSKICKYVEVVEKLVAEMDKKKKKKK